MPLFRYDGKLAGVVYDGQDGPLLFLPPTLTTGNIYYCDPVNGSDSNAGRAATNAVKTLAQGYSLLVSGHNDVLVLIGNGASTGSARVTTFTWAKDAAHLVGMCSPAALSQRARIAFPTTTGLTVTANFFTVSGNGCLFQNLSFFQGASAGQTGIAAEICMTVSGMRNAFLNCDFEGMGDSVGATDTGSRNLLITAGENFFSHCNVGIDTVVRTNINASVEIKGNIPRTIFEDCTFPIWSSDGLQYILFGAAASALDRFTLFKRCNVMAAVNGTVLAAVCKLVANVGGIVCFDSGCGFFNCTAVGDATSKAQIFVSGGTATNGVKGIVAT